MKERLEEAAKNESEYLADYDDKEMYQNGFIAGALWQQEQDKKMYSEEDMVKAIYFGANGMYGYQIGEEGYTINQIKKFLQQFKNK